MIPTLSPTTLPTRALNSDIPTIFIIPKALHTRLRLERSKRLLGAHSPINVVGTMFLGSRTPFCTAVAVLVEFVLAGKGADALVGEVLDEREDVGEADA